MLALARPVRRPGGDERGPLGHLAAQDERALVWGEHELAVADPQGGVGGGLADAVDWGQLAGIERRWGGRAGCEHQGEEEGRQAGERRLWIFFF